VGGGGGGAIGLVAVHAGSGSVQAPSVEKAPSEESTTLVISVVPGGRGLSTVTVKCTVDFSGSVALLAASTGTFWVQAVPAGEVTGSATQCPQPSLGGPV
jgi:hypothetical protein